MQVYKRKLDQTHSCWTNLQRFSRSFFFSYRFSLSYSVWRRLDLLLFVLFVDVIRYLSLCQRCIRSDKSAGICHSCLINNLWQCQHKFSLKLGDNLSLLIMNNSNIFVFVVSLSVEPLYDINILVSRGNTGIIIWHWSDACSRCPLRPFFYNA